MKLTKAQRNVLARMESEEVWTTSGRNPSAFWHGHIADKSPGFPTIQVLSQLGLIEQYERDVGGAKYRITPAGRSALTQEGER